MAALRYFSQKLLLNNLKCSTCKRFLNYTALEYDHKENPAPIFFNKEVQSLLKSLTRVDLLRVYKRRKLGAPKLEDPEYKFMTNEELKEALNEAKAKADEMLQIPPVVPIRKPKDRIFSEDPALKGLEECRIVFTDITYGVKDSERLIVVREPDGTLKEAEWKLRDRINQVYFPKKGRFQEPPRMFEDRYLKSLLERSEYEFILDAACLQFEPDDPTYQRIVSIIYQHLNDHNGFDKLRSTRHFGALVFFLVWNKNIDNLLLELLETTNVEEANQLIQLYSIIHKMQFKTEERFNVIENFIQKCANKKGDLELALQACKEVIKQREEAEKGIKAAHGVS